MLSLYARNTASMGRIDQLHGQKASDVTTSIHVLISRPGGWGPLGVGVHWGETPVVLLKRSTTDTFNTPGYNFRVDLRARFR